MPTLSSDIFSTVPSQDYLSFLEQQKPQHNRIVKFLEFTKEDISKATGVPLSSVRYDDKMPVELHERIDIPFGRHTSPTSIFGRDNDIEATCRSKQLIFSNQAQ